MSADEEFGGANNEEISKADFTEGSELSEESTVEDRIEQEKEMAIESPPEQAEENPFGVEEGKTTEKQEKTRTKAKSMATKQDRDTTKIYDHFTKRFQASKIGSDKTTNMLKQIQKQLVQVEKLGEISNN